MAALFLLSSGWLCCGHLLFGHAAVAELYDVPVENSPQFVARWERSFNEADERTSDVGFDAFVIWWIKPYNISLSFAFL